MLLPYIVPFRRSYGRTYRGNHWSSWYLVHEGLRGSWFQSEIPGDQIRSVATSKAWQKPIIVGTDLEEHLSRSVKESWEQSWFMQRSKGEIITNPCWRTTTYVGCSRFASLFSLFHCSLLFFQRQKGRCRRAIHRKQHSMHALRKVVCSGCHLGRGYVTCAGRVNERSWAYPSR